MNPMRIAVIFFVLSGSAGCAYTRDVKSLSDASGVYVSSLDEGTKEFVEAQALLNRENEAHLQTFRAFTESNEAEIVQQHLAWSDAGDARRIDSFGRAASVSAKDVAAGLQETTVKPVDLSFKGGGGYGDASASLGEISKGPTLLQALEGLFDYGGQVVSAYEDLHKAAADKSSKSKADTTNADNQALPITDNKDSQQ